MRIVITCLLLAGAVSVGGCGFLKPGGSAETRWANLEKTRAAKANPQAGQEQICRSLKVTGSNLPQRVCSTQAEWDAADAQARTDAETFNREMRSGNGEPGRDGVQR